MPNFTKAGVSLSFPNIRSTAVLLDRRTFIAVPSHNPGLFHTYFNSSQPMNQRPSEDWKSAVSAEYTRRTKDKLVVSGNDFPLIASTIYEEEILAAVDSILNGQLTMSNHVREFEELFAQAVGEQAQNDGRR